MILFKPKFCKMLSRKFKRKWHYWIIQEQIISMIWEIAVKRSVGDNLNVFVKKDLDLYLYKIRLMQELRFSDHCCRRIWIEEMKNHLWFWEELQYGVNYALWTLLREWLRRTCHCKRCSLSEYFLPISYFTKWFCELSIAISDLTLCDFSQ